MYNIVHKPCGQTLFAYDIEPIPGSVIEMKHAHFPEGVVYTPGQAPFCETCGRRIMGPAELAPGEPFLKSYDLNDPEDVERLLHE